MATKRKEAPFAIHPGEHLDEFLEEYGISAYRLAKAIKVPQDRISKILHGDRAITADTALRLGRFFNMSPEFWVGLQEQYELELAQRDHGAEIESSVVPLDACG